MKAKFYGVTIQTKLSSELYLSGSGSHKESVSGLKWNSQDLSQINHLSEITARLINKGRSKERQGGAETFGRECARFIGLVL